MAASTSWLSRPPLEVPLFKRELFALIAGPIVLGAIIWAPAWVFVVVLDLVILGAAVELLRMATSAGIRCGRTLPLAFLASALAASFFVGPSGLAFAVAAAVILLPALHLGRSDAPEGALAGTSVAVFTVAYLGVTAACLGWLRTMPADNTTGIKVLLLFLLSIWIGDSGAYYVGKNLGRHRMSPRISPKKTWEGLAGGVVATLAGASIFHLLFPLPFGWAHVLGIAAVLSITAPIGDLVESLFKRDTGTKDSSNLIPGHGGLLDRTDSLVFAAPFVLLYLVVMGLLG